MSLSSSASLRGYGLPRALAYAWKSSEALVRSIQVFGVVGLMGVQMQVHACSDALRASLLAVREALLYIA